jgi:hypothetical protein
MGSGLVLWLHGLASRILLVTTFTMCTNIHSLG